MKLEGPRMKVSMRPSGESAGWTAESGRFVICTHSERAGAEAGRFSSHQASPAAATTSATTPIAIATKRRGDPARRANGRGRRNLRREFARLGLLLQLFESELDIGDALGAAFRILAQATGDDLFQLHRHGR